MKEKDVQNSLNKMIRNLTKVYEVLKWQSFETNGVNLHENS